MPKRKRVLKRKQSQRSSFDRYLTLDWKEVYLLVILWFLFVVLHNLYNIIFKVKDVFLIFIAMKIIPVFFALALIYTFAKKLKRKMG